MACNRFTCREPRLFIHLPSRHIGLIIILLILHSGVNAAKEYNEDLIRELVAENLGRVHGSSKDNWVHERIFPIMDAYDDIEDPELKAEASFVLGHYYRYSFDADNSRNYFLKAAMLYKETNQWGKYLMVMKDYCTVSMAIGKTELIEPTLKECIEISKKHDVGYYVLDPIQELMVHLSYTQGDYRQAIKYGLMFFDTLHKYQALGITGDDFGYTESMDAKIVELELGHSYLELGDLEKAEGYLLSAEKFFLALNDDEKLSRVYRHLSLLAGYQNKQDSLIVYLKKFDMHRGGNNRLNRKILFSLPTHTREIETLRQAYLESQKEVISLTRTNYTILAFLALSIALTSYILWIQRKSRKKQKRINELLSRDFENSKKLNEEKNKYFSILSHELRTPIFAVTGLAKLLQEQGNNTKENIEAIINSGNHLLHLVNNVLQHNKLEESDQVVLDEFDFDLNDALTEVKQTTSYIAGQKNVEVIVVNSSEGSGHLLGDKQKLSQILVNLITNAIRYSPENGQVDLQVSGGKRQQNKITYHFEVRDYGEGIEEAKIPFLFDYRKTTFAGSDDNLRGMGIGLFVVDRFIQAMEGHVRVESRPGRGAKFIFDLQFKPGAYIPPTISGIPKTQEEINILVVDDIKINLIVTQKTLMAIGIRCFTATDLDPVIDIIREKNIDLVLMDLNMPSISGYDLSKKIREAGLNIPIIAHTAVIKENIDYEAMKEADIVDSLIKPYPIEDLREKLTKYLNVTF